MLPLALLLVTNALATDQVYVSAWLARTDDPALAATLRALPALEPVDARLAWLVLSNDPKVEVVTHPSVMTAPGERASLEVTRRDRSLRLDFLAEAQADRWRLALDYANDLGPRHEEFGQTLSLADGQTVAFDVLDLTVVVSVLGTDGDALAALTAAQDEAALRYAAEYARLSPRQRRRALAAHIREG